VSSSDFVSSSKYSGINDGNTSAILKKQQTNEIDLLKSKTESG